ncbi:membrane dipeptidase [Deinobacterium chartae]|uniref:Membrane dipeptidase n=1 Tax=Deinobacterium chartae TaxID=521158 RepID=A0A841HZK4_9DEIO|nr:membrane dipeptidase [Deinobacterium chartae]MBB6098104.1 membrane dipeptidase [Deinobacterium chartae]
MSAPVRPNRGFHELLEEGRAPYLYVDACIQAWPDADYASAHRHGVAAYGVTAWHPQISFEQAFEELMDWHRVARENPRLSVAYTAQDIRDAWERGDATLLLASQDGEFIGGKLHRVEAFYRLGLRITLFAYNRSNLICGGCLDREDSGLTRFGRRVLEECNRVGLLIDCSHVSRRSSLELTEFSADPVVYTHANPAHLCQHPRNIDDEQIRAVAARGGVIGLVSWGPLVQKNGQASRPSVEDFLDHIDYVADLLGGTQAIGLGTDMSLGSYPPHRHDPWGDPDYPPTMARYNAIPGMPTTPLSPLRFVEGFDSFSQIGHLAERLSSRGYGESDIRGILGENFLRVFEQVWKPV